MSKTSQAAISSPENSFSHFGKLQLPKRILQWNGGRRAVFRCVPERTPARLRKQTFSQANQASAAVIATENGERYFAGFRPRKNSPQDCRAYRQTHTGVGTSGHELCLAAKANIPYGFFCKQMFSLDILIASSQSELEFKQSIVPQGNFCRLCVFEN